MAARLSAKILGSFASILVQHRMTLAVTIVPDRLLLISGVPPNGVLIQEVMMSRPWGLATDGDRLAVATRREVTIFSGNPRLAPYHPEKQGQFDAFYAPRLSYFTGECLIHDITMRGNVVIAANTRFSCICRVDGQFNFTPIWKPPFISALMAEDRCHLNGFALEGERLRYVTAFGSFDTSRGWRSQPPLHGIIMDTDDGSFLADDLSMPHSPRIVDGRLFVLESGRGAVLEFDPLNGTRRTMAHLPGLPRGLCHHNGVLFVGLSRPRTSAKRWQLPILDSGSKLISGIAALDQRTGALLGLLEFGDAAEEVFDLQVLPTVVRPGILDMVRWDGLSAIETPEAGYWMKLERPDKAAVQPRIVHVHGSGEGGDKQ